MSHSWGVEEDGECFHVCMYVYVCLNEILQTWEVLSALITRDQSQETGHILDHFSC